jgi:hypothetical protein
MKSAQRTSPARAFNAENPARQSRNQKEKRRGRRLWRAGWLFCKFCGVFCKPSPSHDFRGNLALDYAALQRSFYDLTYADLEREMASAGLHSAHTRTLWRALHREIGTPLAARNDLQRPLSQWIIKTTGSAEGLSSDEPAIVVEVHSSDGLTRKFLLQLADGRSIETVVMRYARRFTAMREYPGRLRHGMHLFVRLDKWVFAASPSRRNSRTGPARAADLARRVGRDLCGMLS